MAEYIKREMPNMDGKGERKAYYKIRTYSNLRSEEFINKICYPGSGLNKGDVSKVMCRMVDEMKRWLAEGHTITIDELGTFSLSIGVLDDDEVEDFEGNGKKVNAKRIGVRGVNFRPEKQMVIMVVPATKKADILNVLYDTVGISQEAQGIAFSIPVDDMTENLKKQLFPKKTK